MAIQILSDGKLSCLNCNETLRAERGHDKDGIIPYLVEGKRVFRCPITFITSVSWEYIKAYSFFEKSLLPNGVGWVNEANKYTQAMMFLSNEFKKQVESKEKSYGRSRNQHITKADG